MRITPILYVTSLQFLNPLPVASQDSKVNSSESVVVGHLGIFDFCFSNTMNSDILLFWCTVFCIQYCREVFDFGPSTPLPYVPPTLLFQNGIGQHWTGSWGL